jgi:hypothetical protein
MPELTVRRGKVDSHLVCSPSNEKTKKTFTIVWRENTDNIPICSPRIGRYIFQPFSRVTEDPKPGLLGWLHVALVKQSHEEPRKVVQGQLERVVSFFHRRRWSGPSVTARGLLSRVFFLGEEVQRQSVRKAPVGQQVRRFGRGEMLIRGNQPVVFLRLKKKEKTPSLN